MEPNDSLLLEQAKQKAQSLLERLMRDQADLQRNPATLAAQAAVEGRAVHAAAVDAARQTVENLARSLAGQGEGGFRTPPEADSDQRMR